MCVNEERPSTMYLATKYIYYIASGYKKHLFETMNGTRVDNEFVVTLLPKISNDRSDKRMVSAATSYFLGKHRCF